MRVLQKNIIILHLLVDSTRVTKSTKKHRLTPKNCALEQFIRNFAHYHVKK